MSKDHYDFIVKYIGGEGVNDTQYTRYVEAVNTLANICFQTSKQAVLEEESQNQAEHVQLIEDEYNEHIKNFPLEYERAFHDDQPIETIARDTSIAISGLCQSMINIAESP